MTTTAITDNLGILLIDVQPRFLDAMHGEPEPMLARIEQLLILAGWLRLPVIATLEEPVERKGQLPARLERVFPASGNILTKEFYNLIRESEIQAAIKDSGRQQWAVTGGETDVCVLQSALGLLESGHDVFLLEDCLFSSEPHINPAIRRMQQAGAIPCTFKTLFYELVASEDPQRWKDIERLMAEQGLVPPESLPN